MINSVLLLLCGVLLLALAGLTGVWRLQRPQVAEPPLPPAAAGGGQPPARPQLPMAPAPATTPAAVPPTPPPVPAIPEPPADSVAAAGGSGAGGSAAAGAEEALSRAQASVERLVAALADKDFAQVERRVGAGAADQFEPGFYHQFDGVSLQELRPAGQRGSIVTLEGVMVFRWPDGSEQSETRRFVVDSDHDPPLIVSSSFGRVLKQR